MIKGQALDDLANIYSICRHTDESDEQLRKRINRFMRDIIPNQHQIRLFYFLAKLGVRTSNSKLPAYVAVIQ